MAPPPTTTRIVAMSAAAVGSANLVAERVIYGGVILPRFGTAAATPGAWWVLMYTPVLVACIAVAWRCRNRRDGVAAALAAGAVTALVKLALTAVHAPGHVKALEASALAWATLVGLARMTSGYVVLFVVLVAILGRAHGHEA